MQRAEAAPLLAEAQSPSYVTRVTQLLHKVVLVLLFQRRGGREEKRQEKELRGKLRATFAFSMMGLVATVFMDAIPHAHGLEATVDGPSVWEQSTDYHRAYLVPLQVTVTLSSLITVVLICQTYQLRLRERRRQWVMRDSLTEAAYQSGRMDERERRRLDQESDAAFSFLASAGMTWTWALEVMIHVCHPIIFLSDESGMYEVAKVVTLLRLYLVLKMVHYFTAAYRDRHEIVQHYETDVVGSSASIDGRFTLALWVQRYVLWVVNVWTVLTTLVGGALMFYVERNAEAPDDNETFTPSDIQWAGSFWNACWFTFVTATTIGYGDYYPLSFRGRVSAVVIALSGFFLTTVFQAQLTNQLKPTKRERFIKDYLQSRRMMPLYEDRAARVIQAMWRARQHRGVFPPYFHKGHVVKDSISKLQQYRSLLAELAMDSTQANDVVLGETFDALTAQANALGLLIQEQRSELFNMHKRLHKQLRQIRQVVEERQERQRGRHAPQPRAAARARPGPPAGSPVARASPQGARRAF